MEVEKARADRFALSVEKYVPDSIISAVFEGRIRVRICESKH
jgi:hypothetical protein